MSRHQLPITGEYPADKTRIDWLDAEALLRQCTLSVMERHGDAAAIHWAGIEWDYSSAGIREAIDEARRLRSIAIGAGISGEGMT